MKDIPHLQAHLQLFFNGINVYYGCKRACKFPSQVKLFFKFPSLQKFLKRNRTIHHKTNTQLDNECKNIRLTLTRRIERLGHNTGLAKVAVKCFYDSFVGKQTLVHLINICGENRHLRQARNRYMQLD